MGKGSPAPPLGTLLTFFGKPCSREVKQKLSLQVPADRDLLPRDDNLDTMVLIP